MLLEKRDATHSEIVRLAAARKLALHAPASSGEAVYAAGPGFAPKREPVPAFSPEPLSLLREQ